MDDNKEIQFKDYENGTNLKKAAEALEKIINFADQYSIIRGVVAEKNEHRIPSVEMIDVEKEDRLNQVDFVLDHFSKRHPDTILIVPKKLTAVLESLIFYKYSKVSGGEKSFKRSYEACKDQIVGYQIHAYYGSACVSYSIGYHGFFEVDLDYDPYNDEDYEIEVSPEEQEAFEREENESRERVDALARELSQDSRLRLAKNRDQREAAFRLFFGKSSNKIDSYEIERIAQRAIGIFEIETLPKLVQDLLNNCQSAKEISENLGISLAKVKKVIAAIS